MSQKPRHNKKMISMPPLAQETPDAVLTKLEQKHRMKLTCDGAINFLSN